jgi:hypothetical protein
VVKDADYLKFSSFPRANASRFAMECPVLRLGFQPCAAARCRRRIDIILQDIDIRLIK